MGKLGQSFLRCLACRHLRQSRSLMQHSRSLLVSLGIRGQGSVGFQDVAMVKGLFEVEMVAVHESTTLVSQARSFVTLGPG